MFGPSEVHAFRGVAFFQVEEEKENIETNAFTTTTHTKVIIA
jgi:hypothetical protein